MRLSPWRTSPRAPTQLCLPDPDQQLTAPTLQLTPMENQLGTPRPLRADGGTQSQKLLPYSLSTMPQPLADHSTRLDRDKGPRHRPGSSPQENSTTRSASTPAPASSCSRKSDTCRPEGQHRHLPESWARRGQVRETRRERSRESLGTDSLKEDKTNDSRCWQPHSNHLRE